MSGIDLNRAGTPLLEIVTEPDMRSSDEAVAYAKQLHALVQWVGICDGNMQEGSFRCDANVSVRPAGTTKLGTRCEIKNLNSFRFMQEAIDFEVRRQIALIEDGGRVVQETRLYDPDKHETRSMRSKEDAQDYRYFPDPDLPPLVIADDWIARVKAGMPELPTEMKARFAEQYLLYEADATALTATRATAEYFTQTMDALAKTPGVPYSSQGNDATNGKVVANWVINELGALLNNHQADIADAPIAPPKLAELIAQTDRFKGTISHKAAKDVLAAMWAGAGRRGCDHRCEGSCADIRHRCDRETGGRCAGGEPRHRRRSQGRQGEGVQFAGRQSDGRVEGQGEPCASQRDPEAEAGLTSLARQARFMQSAWVAPTAAGGAAMRSLGLTSVDAPGTRRSAVATSARKREPRLPRGPRSARPTRASTRPHLPHAWSGHQRLVPDPPRTRGIFTQPLPLVGLEFLVVAFEEHDFRVALERHDVGGDPV